MHPFTCITPIGCGGNYTDSIKSGVYVCEGDIVNLFVACHGRAVKSTRRNSGVSDQQSVGSSPSCDTCVHKHYT